MSDSRENVLERPAPPADARLPYGPDPLHFGDLRLPSGPGPHPVVILVHGGFWRARFDLEYMGHAAAALSAAGTATWNVEYRRLGNDGGGWPGTLLDVARAADRLRTLAPQYGLDLARTIALGHSAGGHLALWLAARRRIPAGDPLHAPDPLPLSAVVPLAGVSDLRHAWELGLSQNVVRDFLGGSPAEVPTRYATASPAELLPLGVPQVLIHGTADEPVPYAISTRYRDRAAALGDDVRLVTVRGAGHFEIVDPTAPEWGVVRDAAQSLVVKNEPNL